MLADVSAIVLALQSASVIEDVRQIAHRAFADYGFDGFMCITVPLAPDSAQLFVLHSNWPPQWMNYYIERGYQQNDPALKHVSETDEPFLSRDVPGMANDPIEAEIRAEKKAIGLEFELAIPVQIETDLRGGVFLYGPEEVTRKANRHELQLIAMALFAVAHQFSTVGTNPLTNRELEMLRWASEGKTTGVIAKIAGLTPRTVNTHFENAARKLGTENRLHTVVVAMKMKLLK